MQNEPKAFSVLAKPTGPLCNLDCRYCFYLEKDKLYPAAVSWRMQEEVLESYIRQYIQSQDVPVVSFAWQGGEPTILGVEFFAKAMEIQKRWADGKRIENALQTNGILLDDRWCDFLSENRFLVGLSIDGPQEIHDRYRVDKGGRPTFGRVMGGLALMKKHGVEFNTLTCVQRHNSQRPKEVYRFLKEIGSRFLQLIPVVERIASRPAPGSLVLVSPAAAEAAAVSEWSVQSLQFGKFLCTIFDEWVRHDVGQVYVQLFDVALESWLGMQSSLCVFGEICGSALALEHNGDLYSCDHYVYPENRLGNIMEQSLPALALSGSQRKFGLDKRETLPRCCTECEVRFACNGECPKHRFLEMPGGGPCLNYLCAGYKLFFNHIDPYMQFMAREFRQERAPANVMDWVRLREREESKAHCPGRNDPCPCGSGIKYKRCCGSG